MITLAEIERELIDLADNRGWGGVSEDGVRALARRIGVEIERQRLNGSAAA